MRIFMSLLVAASTVVGVGSGSAHGQDTRPCVSYSESQRLTFEKRFHVETDWEVRGVGLRTLPPNWPGPMDPVLGVDPQNPRLKVRSYPLCGHADGWEVVYYRPGSRRAVMYVHFIPPAA